MPLWLHIAAGIAAGTLIGFVLLVALAWLVPLGVAVADRVRRKRDTRPR